MHANCNNLNENAQTNKPLSETILNGVKSGFHVTWNLTKIIVPIYFFITFLKYTGVLEWISLKFAPMMSLFGLPGEAAIALVFGNGLHLYAAIGVITTLSLTQKQITVIAIMLLFSHSLFMETAVAKKTGVNVFIIILIRISLAVTSGMVLNRLI